MAHADIFERISTRESDTMIEYEGIKSRNSQQKDSTMRTSGFDKKTIETIKILGKQVLELREIVEKQTEVITSLKDEVLTLRNRANEQEGNMKMSMIDQKDIAHQLRILKATVNGQQFVETKTNNIEEISKKFYEHYDQSQVVASAQPMQENTQLLEPEMREAPVMPVEEPVQPVEPTVNLAQQAAAAVASMNTEDDLRSKSAENIAKEFIFGRIPKLLNLE